MGEGRVYLRTNSRVDPNSTLMMSIGGDGYVREGVAREGQIVHTVVIDMVGAGAHWVVYLGEQDGRSLFRVHTWLYDIVPESKRVVSVPAYGPLPEGPDTLAQP